MRKQITITSVVILITALSIFLSEFFHARECMALKETISEGQNGDILCKDINLMANPASIMYYIELLRIIFGSVFILFLPGYWVSRCFFIRGEIDVLERLVLSFALAISVVPLLSFYLNLIGMKVTTWNVFITATGITILSIVYICYKNKKN